MSRNIHIPAPKYKVGYTAYELSKISELLGLGKAHFLSVKFKKKDFVYHVQRYDLPDIQLVTQDALIREIGRVKNGKIRRY